ncbi:MAG: DUF1592 domain-containing protein [Zavarzinella sp.]
MADGAENTGTRFLQQYCTNCHGETIQESGVRVDQLADYRPGERNFWTMIHQKIQRGEMPPKTAVQPSAKEKEAMLTWIRNMQIQQPPVGFRRLNRRELAASLREITGLNIDYGFSMPADGTVAGFDTGAENLPDSPDGVAHWLTMTQRAVNALSFFEPPSTQLQFSADLQSAKDPKKTLEAWKQGGATIKVKGIPRVGQGLWLEPKALGERDEFSFTIPVQPSRTGVLRLKLLVSVHKSRPELPSPHLWVDVAGQDIDFCEISNPPDRPRELIYEVQLDDLAVQDKGVKISLSNKVEVPYAVNGYENDDRSNPNDAPPGGTGLFRPKFDRKSLPLEQHPAPYLVLHAIELNTNYNASWPPTHWQVKLPEKQPNSEYAARLIGLWQEKAWRRPITAEESKPFIALYEQQRKLGLSFDAAVRAACQSILMTTQFRFLGSPGGGNSPNNDPFQLASRISFDMWGGPTDQELLNVAASGKLSEPKQLNRQIHRLLESPRCKTGFLKPFTRQWLELDQPITITSSHISKQDFRFARHLKESMKAETTAYIAEMLSKNRPISELIDSNWTMLNESLAYHYQLPPVVGAELRKVNLPGTFQRGGLIAHAGIQSMLCWMGDNWVIYRGVWFARAILDMPPPAPPLEVPELDPARTKGKTYREILKIHQEDRHCAVCHKNIDPLGFAFQNFDISGRWRTEEFENYKRSELDGKIAWVGSGKSRPVDSVGSLPRGETFQTYPEFKKLVVSHYSNDIARGVLKKLFLYTTGYPPGVVEMEEIEAILKANAKNDYSLRDLVVSTLLSKAFLRNELKVEK